VHQIDLFVPCLLIEEQKENFISTCHDLMEALERDPDFLLKIITRDKMCYCVKPRNKAGGVSVEEFMICMCRNERQVSSDMKNIFICPLCFLFFPSFFSFHRLVHYEFVL